MNENPNEEKNYQTDILDLEKLKYTKSISKKKNIISPMFKKLDEIIKMLNKQEESLNYIKNFLKVKGNKNSGTFNQ